MKNQWYQAQLIMYNLRGYMMNNKLFGKEKFETLIGGIFFLVLLVAGLNWFNSSEVVPAQKPAQKVAEKVAEKSNEIVKPQPSMGITAEQYKSQFNDASLATDGSPFEIINLDIKKGDVFDTAQITFTKNNFMIIGVTKQGLINSVSTISSGDGTINSGLNMLYISVVVIRSINTTIDKEAATKMGLDLFTRAGKSKNKPVEEIINGIKYYAISSDKLGYWFGAELVDK
jgi:hypothetical protein